MDKSMQQVTLLPGTAGQTFVLGLKWKRIVTGSSNPAEGMDVARKTAAEGKSGHMLVDRDATGKVRSVGHGSLGKKAPAKVLSLAVAFARQFKQIDKAMIALRLPGTDEGEALVWVCGVSDGVVYQNTDVVVRSSAVMEQISRMTGRFESGTVEFYGDFLDESHPMSQSDLMGWALSNEEECRLQKVGVNFSVPRPVRIGVGGLLAILVVQHGFDWFHSYREAKLRAAEAALRTADMTPQEVWAKSVSTWLSTSDVAPPTTLEDLFQTVGQISFDVVHWKLQGLECTRSGARWNCKATYNRDEVARADSMSFLAALPRGWDVTWTGLNAADVKFSVACRSAKFDLKHAPKVDEIYLPLLSKLQRYSKAFTKREGSVLGSFGAVEIPMPKRSDGTAYVVDPKLLKPTIMVAPVSLSGPLRSMFLLMDQPISWNSVALKVDMKAEASVSTSALVVDELKGDVYAVR
jgi:hypothetical protein